MATSGNANAEPTGAPVRKVVAGFLAGVLSAGAIYYLNHHLLKPQTQITPEVAAAITTVFTFIVSYIVPPSGGEAIVP